MNGSDRVFTWLDGRAYEGGYKDDKKHGWGVFKLPGGKEWRGNWHEGQQHGDRELYNSEDGTSLAGKWSRGKQYASEVE
jgi:hypothetical protein